MRFRALLAAAALSASCTAPALAQQASTQPAGPGVPNVVKLVLFPLYLGARIQSSLDPEKPSCWNDGSTEVAGCRVAEKYDEATQNRPTPYGN